METKTETFIKKIISGFILIFYAVLLFSLVGCAFKIDSSNAVVISTVDGDVKIELTNSVTKQDDSIDKLSKKIKITNGSSSQLGNLVKVTDDSVMFDYSSGEDVFYFSANQQTIKQATQTQYVATSGTINISNKSELEAFRDNVNKANNGNTYSGSTINLTADIDLSSVDNWNPIGGVNSFSGVFNGNNHKIENLKMSEQYRGVVQVGSGYYSTPYYIYKPLGLFGCVVDGTIKNLHLNNVKINSTTEKAYPQQEGVIKIGALAGSVSGESTIKNIKLSNATITMNNTNSMTIGGSFSSLDIVYNSENASSAGGLVGVVDSKVISNNKNGTDVSISYVEIVNLALSVTGTGGMGSGAGGIVGAVRQRYYTKTAGGYTNPYPLNSEPKLTVSDCLINAKINVKDNYNNVYSRYSCFGGVVGRYAGIYWQINDTRYSSQNIKISKCVSKIDPSSSVASVGTNNKVSSHPIFCYYDLILNGITEDELNTQMSSILTKNYYISTGFTFTSTANATKLEKNP